MSDSRNALKNPQPTVTEKIDIFGDYQASLDAGRSEAASALGAFAGAATRGATQMGIFKAVPKIIGGGMTKAVAGSAAINYGFGHIGDVGRAASHVIAVSADKLGDKIGDAGIQYTVRDEYTSQEFTADLSRKKVSPPKPSLNLYPDELDVHLHPANPPALEPDLYIDAKASFAATSTASQGSFRNAVFISSGQNGNHLAASVAENKTDKKSNSIHLPPIKTATKESKSDYFGVKNPPKFSLAFEGDHGIRNVKNLDVNNIRKLQGNHVLLYAITDNGLIISSQGEPGKRIQHLHLTNKQDVYCAGNLTVINGKIVEINPSSGGYRPEGQHLDKLVTTTFVKNGFKEAAGKFNNLYQDQPQLPRQSTQESMFQTPSDQSIADKDANRQRNRATAEQKHIRDTVIADPNVYKHMESIASNVIAEEKKKTPSRQPAPKASAAKDEVKKETPVPTAEDEKTAEFLIAYGTSPDKVTKMFQDESTWAMAKVAAKQFQEQEKKREGIKTQQQFVEFFDGMGSIFEALSQCKSPELKHIGKLGLPIMSTLAHVEKLWGVFSGEAGSLATAGFFGSFGSIAGLTIAGISLLSALFSSEEDQQQQLMESLKDIYKLLSTVQREMHERFDRVDSAIHYMASMMAAYCNQILKNQQALFEQNKRHIELTLQGFRSVTTMLGDLRAETKLDHQKLFAQFDYLIRLKEIEILQGLKESIEGTVENIQENSKVQARPNDVVHTAVHHQGMRDALIELGKDVKSCASAFYNGIEQFSISHRQPFEAAKFLARRSMSHDDALGFLAKVIAEVTEKPLSGINADKLPVTALWATTVDQYITYSQLPVFSDYDNTSTLREIVDQRDNLIRFLQYIRKSGVVEKLLERHKKYLNDLQLALHDVFIRQQKSTPGIKDKKSHDSQPRMMSVGEFCIDGAAKSAIDHILNQVDYNYLLLNRFVYLGGYSQAFQSEIAQLDCSTTLSQQSFNFNTTPVTAAASDLNDESQAAGQSRLHETNYQNSHLETISALLYGKTQLIFMSSMCYSEEKPSAQDCSLHIGKYELSTMKSSPITTVDRNTPSSFPLVNYKRNFNSSVDHTWASTHITQLSRGPYLVFCSGGSGYITLFNLNTGASELVNTSHHVDEHKRNLLSFPVPVPKFRRHTGDLVPGPRPDTTSYTHILNDRYLHLTKMVWQAGDYPKVDFQVVDLESKRPLQSQEVPALFHYWDREINIGKLMTPSRYMPISPNQVYINTIRPTTRKKAALVYGFVQVTHRYQRIIFLENDRKPEDMHLNASTIAMQLVGSLIKAFWMNGDRLESRVLSESNVPEIKALLTEHIRHHGATPCIAPELITKVVLKYRCLQDQLSASFYYKPIVDRNEIRPADRKREPPGFGIYHFPIAVKTIHQTSSEVLNVDGDNKLFIPVSITGEDDRSKLVIISADYFNSPTASLIEAKEFDLRADLHPNSDWQVMRTAVAKIGDRNYLFITLLDHDYKILIFRYDPKKKELLQLIDGPQLQFVNYSKGSGVSYRNHEIIDKHLMQSRQIYPGFYPVRSLELRVSEVNNMSTLCIAYPTIQYPHSTNYKIEVASVPLSPNLTFKPIPIVPQQVVSVPGSAAAPVAASASSSTPNTAPSTSIEIPANHLTADILSVDHLLFQISHSSQAEKSSEKKVEIATELPKENVLILAYRSCKDIQEILLAIVDEVKLSEATRKSVDINIKKITDIIAKFDEKEKVTPDLISKILPQLEEMFKIINKTDGLLKFSKMYSNGVGKNVDRLIEQLQSEINAIKKASVTPQPSKSFFAKNGIFSSGADSADLGKKLRIGNNMDIWSKFKRTDLSGSLNEELQREAKKWGLTCKNMDEDGNCLFHAVADQLLLRTNNKSETFATLRAKALNHILSHEDEYKPFMVEDFNKFINENVKNRAWADHVMILALSRALNMSIVIVRSDHAEPTIIRQPKPKSTSPHKEMKDRPILYIGLEVERHYQSLEGYSAKLLAKARKAEVDRFGVQEKQSVSIQPKGK